MNLLEINANKLVEILNTDIEKGLQDEQVEKNRKEFTTSQNRGVFASVIKSVYSDVMPILFIVAVLISFFYEKRVAGTTIALLLYSVVFCFLKYLLRKDFYKTAKMLNSPPARARVVRNGVEKEIDYKEVVPGDVLILKLGDVIGCDAIILWQDTLRVSEIQLTGNSSPVVKLTQEDVLNGKGVPYYECLLFAGSVVMSGEGRAIVCNTGKDVFDKRNKVTTRSKHARRTKIFEICSFVSKQISLIWILLSFIIFVTGAVKGIEAFDLFFLSVTMATATLPDLVMTLFDLALSVGSKRLYRNGSIIRDMSALDRMCDISCIIADDSRYFRTSVPKPHTVYVNDEQKTFKDAGDEDTRQLFEYALIASVSGEEGLKYNALSVERSLVMAGRAIGIEQSKLYEKFLLLEKRPFTSATGISRAVVYHDKEFFIISLGTPSAIMKTCTHIENHGETLPLEDRARRVLRELSRVIASRNEGVVAVSIKKIEYREGLGQIDNNRGHSFVGYIGLHTPINTESARAVNLSLKSGTDVILMTDEGYSTSKGFAKSLSILKEGEKAIEPKELEGQDMGLFRADIKNYKVFVSFSPDDKARIASFRKSEGDIIATTTSNVRDLRLLLEADVSFCPSDSPDEVVKQNSDVIIEKGFEMIPECIKGARAIYRNTRHMLQFVFSSNLVLFFSVMLALLALGKTVFTPVLVMIYSVLTVLPLSLALSTENVRGNELRDTFGAQNLGINLHNMVALPLIVSFVTGVVVTLVAKTLTLSGLDTGAVSAAAFTTLITSAIFSSWAFSMGDGFDVGVFRNKQLVITSLLVILITALAVLIKPFSSLLLIAPTTVETFIYSFAMGFIPPLILIGINLFKKYVFTKN